MKLKLTTKRALEFQKRTGKDLMRLLNEVDKTEVIELSDAVELFCCLGDGYTVDDFDAWDASFGDKLTAILQAVADYFGYVSEKK